MRKMDMLHGSIGDKTVSFAILLAVTGICQQLFNAIDIIIMGVLLVRKPWPPSAAMRRSSGFSLRSL